MVPCVCVCVCAHTPLLPRLLNYEAFTAVVMASSAFGNMSFYFCLGPNIQFEEGSQTIHDLSKKSNEGSEGNEEKDIFASEVTQSTDSSRRTVSLMTITMLMWKMMMMTMFCLFSACRRTTTYRSALTWCSKSS